MKTSLLKLFIATLCLLFSYKIFAAPPAPTLAQRIAAAKAAASEQPLCKSIAPFYWEIGDVTKVLASGSTGDGSITRSSEYNIASASKWVFGAYVVQKLNGKLDAQTKKAVRMMSGYTSLGVFSCIMTPTIGACLNKGDNGLYTKENDGKFYYNGGHFQKWAVDNGLGAMNRGAIVAEYQRVLGNFDFSFGAMQLAGGIKTSAEGYSVFLRNILNGKLLIGKMLGADATCTLPSVCPQAVRSPVRVAWHYSYGHWVEDDPEGDGVFSSPGAFGFYPWIDKSKTYYGIISRHHKPDRANAEIGAGQASGKCGFLIRKAFNSGKAP